MLQTPSKDDPHQYRTAGSTPECLHEFNKEKSDNLSKS